MKPIVIPPHRWFMLVQRLHSDYPPSVLAIKEKTKRVIGFTSRVHRRWVPNPNYTKEGSYKEEIHLDFYNEQKRTFFILKYSEYF